MCMTTPFIVKKLQPTMPPLAKRLATVSLYQNIDPTKCLRNQLEMAQNVKIYWCNWFPLTSASPPLTKLFVRRKTFNDLVPFQPFLQEEYQQPLFGRTKGKLFALYIVGISAQRIFSMKQDVAGHVIHLKAIFKMKLGYFLVNYLSWDILKIIQIRPPPLKFWETRKEPGLNLLEDEMAA